MATGGTGGGLAGAVLAATSPVNLTTVGASDWAHWTSPSGFVHKSKRWRANLHLHLDWEFLDPRVWERPSHCHLDRRCSYGQWIVHAGHLPGGHWHRLRGDRAGRRHRAYPDRLCRRLELDRPTDGHAVGWVRARVCEPAAQRRRPIQRTYQLTYRAAGAGRTLTIQWKQTAGAGNVTLQAAALASGGTPPAVPTNVAASDGTSTTSVAVTWTAVSGATSYTVYRSTSSGVQGQCHRVAPPPMRLPIPVRLPASSTTTASPPATAPAPVPCPPRTAASSR
jgi:hypothetical protein